MHESRTHGFRLTVQPGSLPGAIGPITIQEFAQVVKCETDGQEYLVKMVVDCQPSGVNFPVDKPLWMDFIVEDTSFSNLSDTSKVCTMVECGTSGDCRMNTSKPIMSHCHWTIEPRCNSEDKSIFQSADLYSSTY